jgi:hypothetical protein
VPGLGSRPAAATTTRRQPGSEGRWEGQRAAALPGAAAVAGPGLLECQDSGLRRTRTPAGVGWAGRAAPRLSLDRFKSHGQRPYQCVACRPPGQSSPGLPERAHGGVPGSRIRGRASRTYVHVRGEWSTRVHPRHICSAPFTHA